MNKSPYFGLWLLLAVALCAFVGLSLAPPIEIGGVELQCATFVSELTAAPRQSTVSHDSAKVAIAATGHHATAAKSRPVSAKPKPAELDTLPKTILFIGDSMLEGLSPRLASYAKHNGHKLHSVIWYSSTSEIWGRSDKLAHYIKRYKPDYIFVCLGANELFVRNIATKRAKYVDNMFSQIGNIPYVWIGPPNWKDDTGINHLVSSKAKPGTYFMSRGMHFDRAKDGAHPTRNSAVLWMDSVVRWMKHHSTHPIKMERPKAVSARANSVVVLQPSR